MSKEHDEKNEKKHFVDPIVIFVALVFSTPFVVGLSEQISSSIQANDLQRTELRILFVTTIGLIYMVSLVINTKDNK